MQEKGAERDRILGLYRKGRIGEDTVERQIGEIAAEEDALRVQMAELTRQLESVSSEAAQLDFATAVLDKLRARLHEELSWEARRELMESLVEQVRVDTRQEGEKRVARITVIYRLSPRSGIGPETAGRDGTALPDRPANFEFRIQRRTGRTGAGRLAATA